MKKARRVMSLIDFTGRVDLRDLMSIASLEATLGRVWLFWDISEIS